MSSAQTFYPEPEAAGVPSGWAGHTVADPAARIHPPVSGEIATSGEVEASPERARLVWPRALALCVLLSAVGLVFYVSLFVLVGEEILAAAMLIGLLAGAGMRWGGAGERWSVAFAASLVAAVAWALAVAIGDALLAALDSSTEVRDALARELGSPAALAAFHIDRPVLIAIALGLVVIGAVVSTATFVRTRPPRGETPWW